MCVFMVLDCHLFNDTKLQNKFHICKYLHEYFKEKVEIIFRKEIRKCKKFVQFSMAFLRKKL
jgi:hypothetical protein